MSGFPFSAGHDILVELYNLTKMLQEYPRASMEAELAHARSEAAAAARRLKLLEEEAARSAHHGHPAGPDRPPGDGRSHRLRTFECVIGYIYPSGFIRWKTQARP